MEYEVIIEECKEKCIALKPDTKFKLRDLFQSVVWESWEKKDRLELGRLFKTAVMNKNIDAVIYIGKAQNNSALYQKVRRNEK